MATKRNSAECVSCFKQTKYRCITCYMPVCNLCSTPEFDEDKDGWIAGRRVGYCKGCDDNVQSESLPEIYSSSNCEEKVCEQDEDNSSSDDVMVPPTEKKGKKKGRKAKWSDSLVNDMVDIVVNSEYYKKRLIFMNIKNKKNSEIYEKVLKELKLRANERKEEVPFNANQLRTKFKKLVAECKKIALTIKTASGIKRVQDEKGYGPWFDQLYSLVKTRDSCQPEQSIEPSADLNSSVDKLENSGSSSSLFDDSTTECEAEKSLFVPVKRPRKKKEDNSKALLDIIKKMSEKDPMKEYLEFAHEEAEKARQHEVRLMEIMMGNQMPMNFYH